MLPLCSATTSGSSHYQICFQVEPRSLFPLQKSTLEDRINIGKLTGAHSLEVSYKTRATKFLYAYGVERSPEIGSMESADMSLYQNQFDDIICRYSNDCLRGGSQKLRDINGLFHASDDLNHNEAVSIPRLVESFSIEGNSVEPFKSFHVETAIPPDGDEFPNFSNQLTQNADVSASAASESLSTAGTDLVIEIKAPVSDAIDTTNNTLSNLTKKIDIFLSGINESSNASIGRASSVLEDSYSSITSTFTNAFESATSSLDGAVVKVLSSIDDTGKVAGNKISVITSEFKEYSHMLGDEAINVVRQGIIMLKYSLANAGRFVVNSYVSTRELLPPEIQDELNIFEKKANEILSPIETTFQQVHLLIEAFEKYLGFDPNDPVVLFILLLGSSASLGISYWLFTYGGYSGDLSPNLALQLLLKEEDAVFIDVRPEVLRERDGIPDLRRGARFKYASITLPEMDNSLRKLLKNGKKIDDALIATVIRNLKIVQDGSKVLVMDATGSRSKGIARYLRKFGVKKPYVIQGGYEAWIKSGLRVKELQPETTFTILNEEAEAILEEIQLTPVKIIGYGSGLIAGIYALMEWERTLQCIALLGLAQTAYRRFSSYQNAEDLKRDVRLLLAPVRLGYSWVAGKIEPNKIGLPTSPSSTAVHSRVMQAAARHESQPSGAAEEAQDPPLAESSAPETGGLDI